MTEPPSERCVGIERHSIDFVPEHERHGRVSDQACRAEDRSSKHRSSDDKGLRSLRWVGRCHYEVSCALRSMMLRYSMHTRRDVIRVHCSQVSTPRDACAQWSSLPLMSQER